MILLPSSFPFLGGIARFVPNARLGPITEGLDKLRDEFRDATLDFVAGYGPLRERAMDEWREAARSLSGSAESLLITIEQSFPPASDIAKRFGFETRMFQVAAPDHLRLEISDPWSKWRLPISADGWSRMPNAVSKTTWIRSFAKASLPFARKLPSLPRTSSRPSKATSRESTSGP
jgi:hypothetical protein